MQGSWPDSQFCSPHTAAAAQRPCRAARPGASREPHLPKARSTVALHLNRARAAPQPRVQTAQLALTLRPVLVVLPAVDPVSPPERREPELADGLKKSRLPGLGASHVGRLAPPTLASALTWRHAGPMKHLQARGRAPGVWEDL